MTPTWSVMIPAFNCAKYLRGTLQSVMSQALPAADMQICVVDDCSTMDDPEAVVREVGGGRVEFFRQPRNVGVTRNFNECVRRARGTLLHLLHGDDFVLRDFYSHVADAASRHPECGLFFTRAFFVDETGAIDDLTPRLKHLESGGTSLSPITAGCPVQTPSVVVRRTAYERAGMFDESLVHTADWEMWLRGTALCGALAINEPLACYRVFAAAHSSGLRRKADNLRDYQRMVRQASRYLPDVDERQIATWIAQCALQQARGFEARGDSEAAQANYAFFREQAHWKARCRERLRHVARRLL